MYHSPNFFRACFLVGRLSAGYLSMLSVSTIFFYHGHQSRTSKQTGGGGGQSRLSGSSSSDLPPGRGVHPPPKESPRSSRLIVQVLPRQKVGTTRFYGYLLCGVCLCLGPPGVTVHPISAAPSCVTMIQRSIYINSRGSAQ